MKNSVNTHSVAMLAKIAWYEEIRRPLAGLLISMGILLSLFFIIMLNNSYEYLHNDPLIEIEQVFLTITMFILACYGGTLISSCFSTKPKAISELMLPASQAEKFWMRWVIFVPLFFIAFACSACIVDLLRYALTLMVKGHLESVQLGLTHIDYDRSFWLIVCSCISIQSFFVLGGSVWPRRGLLYTALTIFIYGWAIMIFGTLMATTLRGIDFVPLKHLDLRLSSEQVAYITMATMLATAAVNYALAYFRTKELEIIQRW